MIRPQNRHPVTTIPVFVLLLMAPIVGVLATQPLQVAVVGTLGVLAALFVVTVAQRAVFRDVVLGVCALIIVYPALVPRPDLAAQSVAEGGAVDGRAKILLAVVLVVAAAAIWLWLSHSGSLLVFTEPPMSLFGWYCAAIAISLTYTPDLDWALVATVKLFEVILLLAALTVLLKTQLDLKRMIDVTLGALGFIFLVYWFDKLTGASAGTSDHRFTSAWLHPTQAAILAFAFTAIAGARFFVARTPRDTMIAAGIFGYGAMTGLMTGGKSGAASGGVALALIIVVVVCRRPSVALLDRLAVSGVGLTLIGGYFMASGEGLVGQVRRYEESQYLETSNLTGRVPLWEMTLPRAMESPLFGHGYMSSFFYGLPNGLGWLTRQAHNSFLQTFFDLGLMGLIPVVTIYLYAWKRVLTQIITGDPESEYWERGVELFGGLIVVTIVSFVEDVFGGVFEIRTMIFVIVVFAIFQNDRINRWDRRQISGGIP